MRITHNKIVMKETNETSEYDAKNKTSIKTKCAKTKHGARNRNRRTKRKKAFTELLRIVWAWNETTNAKRGETKGYWIKVHTTTGAKEGEKQREVCQLIGHCTWTKYEDVKREERKTNNEWRQRARVHCNEACTLNQVIVEGWWFSAGAVCCDCEGEGGREGGWLVYLLLMPSGRLYGEYFCSFLGLAEIGVLLHLFNCFSSCSSSQGKSILYRCHRYSLSSSCFSQSSVSTLLSLGLESNRFLLMLFFDSMAGWKGAGGGFVSISGAIIKFDIILFSYALYALFS